LLFCRRSNTTPYTVALNTGSNAGGASNFSARAMKAGSRSLPYQLYLDTGSVQTLSIYGRLPSLANVAPGAYTDTVTVTITH